VSAEPPTCEVCGALISDDRGGYEVMKRGASQPVWVHPACFYVPHGDARFAFLALEDPVKVDRDGWVELVDVEAQRGAARGSDGADFTLGLGELIEARWAERHREREAFRLTPTGRRLRTRLTQSPP
jgi:hypothetical protein